MNFSRPINLNNRECPSGLSYCEKRYNSRVPSKSNYHWQRGKIIKQNSLKPGQISLLGREVWVQMGRPSREICKSIFDESLMQVEDVVRINLAGPDGTLCVASADYIELLSRDESDFAVNVELIPVAEFLCLTVKTVN